VLGGLLSAHMLAAPPQYLTINNITHNLSFHSPYQIHNYTGQLLDLALDLGRRLLPAYTESPTGVPYSRVNLRQAKPIKSKTTNCLAGAGSAILEVFSYFYCLFLMVHS
jgi:ER degradation enhancer, mannosidase alpha-like 1